MHSLDIAWQTFVRYMQQIVQHRMDENKIPGAVGAFILANAQHAPEQKSSSARRESPKRKSTSILR